MNPSQEVEKRSGERFLRLIKTLNLTQKQTAAWLKCCPETIGYWKEKEPRLLECHRRIMIDSGVNPLYIDGVGEVVLPGKSLDVVIDRIHSQFKSSVEPIEAV
jgi:hypothetical protein